MRMIRDSTTRMNIACETVEYNKQKEDEKVPEMVHQKLEEHKEGQDIVYCKRVEQCKRI